MDVNMEVNMCVFSLTAHGVKSSAPGTGNKPNQVLAFSQAEEDALVHSSPYFYRYSVGVVVVDNPLCKIFIFAGFAKRKSNKFSEKRRRKERALEIILLSFFLLVAAIHTIRKLIVVPTIIIPFVVVGVVVVLVPLLSMITVTFPPISFILSMIIVTFPSISFIATPASFPSSFPSSFSFLSFSKKKKKKTL
jgi:hypothetical protein